MYSDSGPEAPEVKEGQVRAMTEALGKGKFNEARRLNAELKRTEAEFLTAAVRNGKVHDVVDLLDALDEQTRKEFLALPETREAAKGSIASGLEKRAANAVQQAFDLYELSKEDLQDDDLIDLAKISMLETIRRGNHAGVKIIADLFDVTQEFFLSDDFKVAATEGKTTLLGKLDRPEEIAAKLVEAMRALGCLIE
ncbi:MAG: hypothetical protein HQ488_03385 [Parcubacteria group bacterium]|nr:hypothetical protein [Parcubacteria group bacterium]